MYIYIYICTYRSLPEGIPPVNNQAHWCRAEGHPCQLVGFKAFDGRDRVDVLNVLETWMSAPQFGSGSIQAERAHIINCWYQYSIIIYDSMYIIYTLLYITIYDNTYYSMIIHIHMSCIIYCATYIQKHHPKRSPKEVLSIHDDPVEVQPELVRPLDVSENGIYPPIPSGND